MESSPAKDRRSTTVPRNQQVVVSFAKPVLLPEEVTMVLKLEGPTLRDPRHCRHLWGGTRGGYPPCQHTMLFGSVISSLSDFYTY